MKGLTTQTDTTPANYAITPQVRQPSPAHVLGFPLHERCLKNPALRNNALALEHAAQVLAQGSLRHAAEPVLTRRYPVGEEGDAMAPGDMRKLLGEANVDALAMQLAGAARKRVECH